MNSDQYRRGEGRYGAHLAIEPGQRVGELNPGSSYVRGEYTFYFLRPIGRLDEALAEAKRVLDQDPLDPWFATQPAYLYHASRQYDLAIETMPSRVARPRRGAS